MGHVYGVAEGVLPVSDPPGQARSGSQLRVSAPGLGWTAITAFATLRLWQPGRSHLTASCLRAIAAAGVGFVITPFNRRWHAAACPHVQRMTVGTPKWFAATPAELADYLQGRIIQYDTAQPIDACPACVPE